ncbi:MAG: zinc/iron permease [Firmicutes bacterium]|nr:zinc/iron permease [Bacillota bacterium]
MTDILVISTLAGLTTVLGAGIAFIWGQPTRGWLAFMLGIAGGVMLAIATMELIPAAMEIGGHVQAVLGVLAGAIVMMLADTLAPENGQKACEKEQWLRTGLLIFFGIAVHNLAEGLAIGAGHIASPALGISIAIGIALHNIPEGMAMAVPLRMGGMKPVLLTALLVFAGLLTAVGAALGYVMFQTSDFLVAGALGLAAGAMYYIVVDELVPRGRKYHRHWAAVGLISGLILGMML